MIRVFFPLPDAGTNGVDIDVVAPFIPIDERNDNMASDYVKQHTKWKQLKATSLCLQFVVTKNAREPYKLEFTSAFFQTEDAESAECLCASCKDGDHKKKVGGHTAENIKLPEWACPVN